MDDEQPTPATTPPPSSASSANAQLEALTKQLQAAQQRPGQQNNPQLIALTEELERAKAEEAANPAAPDTFFGMTFGALMVGLVASTLGLGLIRYGKVSQQWIFAIVGVALMVLPFFVQDALILTVASVGTVGLGFLVRRFVSF